MKIMTVNECIESCEAKRIENTKEYKNSVRKSNEAIRNYELQQAVMYENASREYYNYCKEQKDDNT